MSSTSKKATTTGLDSSIHQNERLNKLEEQVFDILSALGQLKLVDLKKFPTVEEFKSDKQSDVKVSITPTQSDSAPQTEKTTDNNNNEIKAAKKKSCINNTIDPVLQAKSKIFNLRHAVNWVKDNLADEREKELEECISNILPRPKFNGDLLSWYSQLTIIDNQYLLNLLTLCFRQLLRVKFSVMMAVWLRIPVEVSEKFALSQLRKAISPECQRLIQRCNKFVEAVDILEAKYNRSSEAIEKILNRFKNIGSGVPFEIRFGIVLMELESVQRQLRDWGAGENVIDGPFFDSVIQAMPELMVMKYYSKYGTRPCTHNLIKFLRDEPIEVDTGDSRVVVDSHGVTMISTSSTVSSSKLNQCRDHGKKCILCAGSHPCSAMCSKYPTTLDKQNRAEELNFCKHCLSGAHSSNTCNEKDKLHCAICHRQHLTCLCDEVPASVLKKMTKTKKKGKK